MSETPPLKTWFNEKVSDRLVLDMMSITSRSNGGAILSECGQYRYALWRYWRPECWNSSAVTFIMLNPDATKDDLTIRKCVQFAKNWGFGHLIVVNLFAFRASKPKVLREVPDVVGDDNNAFIAAAVSRSDKVICARGNHGSFLNRSETVRHQLRLEFPGKTFAVGSLNKSGEPKNPLYIPYTAELQPMV